MLLNKKIASIAITALLVVGMSPAHAAVKQGSACTKSGAKSGKYTCGINPLTTTKKLVWLTADCISAGKAYATSKTDASTFIAQQANTLQKVQLSIDSWKNVLNLNNTRKAALATNSYIVDYTHSGGKSTPVKVQGMTAALAEINKKIVELTGYRDATAKTADTQKAALSPKYTADQIAGFTTNFKIAATNADAAVKAYAGSLQTLANWNAAISNWQKNVDNITKVAAKIDTDIQKAQNQIDSLTRQLTASTQAQDTIAKELNASVASAKSVTTVACKAGK